MNSNVLRIVIKRQKLEYHKIPCKYKKKSSFAPCITTPNKQLTLSITANTNPTAIPPPQNQTASFGKKVHLTPRRKLQKTDIARKKYEASPAEPELPSLFGRFALLIPRCELARRTGRYGSITRGDRAMAATLARSN